MLNKVILQGRLTADPELKATQSGTQVTTFSVAVDRSFKGKDENAQTTDFFNVVAWRQTAEFISKYFHKGSQILIDGKLQQRKYDDKDGNHRSIVEVVADNVNFCGNKGENAGGGNYAATMAERNANVFPEATGVQASTGYAELPEDDGELPF